ncbi:MAG: four-carbon acid sugar kinase family protein, partial [Bacillota bacterium]
VTAGSGVAIGLPMNWGIAPTAQASALPRPGGLRAIVSGSCSNATRGQVKAFIDAGGPAIALDPLGIASVGALDALIDSAKYALAKGPVLVYSTAESPAVEAVQRSLGKEAAGALVEDALAKVARSLVQQGVRQLIVAGGETSGAVVQALGIEKLRIGPQIDPGVPWCAAQSPVARGSIHLALKSGNFGTSDFFLKSFALLNERAAA